MAIPSSGPLSINDIAAEFGGSTPHSLSEYYAGGGLVPSGTSGTYGAVPTSGQISIQNFYGTSNAVFVAATGGTVTTNGDYKTHTFTSSGTFTVTNAGNAAGSNTVQIWVLGPGGGGATGCDWGAGGGGGGGEGRHSAYAVSATSYTITVGGGGSRAPNACDTGCSASAGSPNSTFGNIIYGNGGGGGKGGWASCPSWRAGGSAGTYSGGNGGSNGTAGTAGPADRAVGTGGPGGAGAANTGGPGASGAYSNPSPSASNNTGGGGSGGYGSNSGTIAGGNGGSGKVTITYKFQ